MKLRSILADPQYSTADISKLYNLSPKGLAYYEKKGVISPSREQGNQYRVFSSVECANLYLAKFYRSFQFSMDESAELAMHASPDELDQQLAKKDEELTKQIHLLQELSTQLKRQKERVSLLSKRPLPWTYTTSPDSLYVFIRRHDRSNGKTICENIDEYGNWISKAPFSAASIMVDPSSLENNAPFFYSLGFIVDWNFADKLGLPQSENTIRLEPRRCLYTIVKDEHTDYFSPIRFLPAAKRIKSEGNKIIGNPFTRMIATVVENEKLMRYDEAWFPIG